MNTNTNEFPKYQRACTVHAAKITGITHNPDGTLTLEFEDREATPLCYTPNEFQLALPEVEDYYVVNENGQVSFLDAPAFESEFTRID